MLSIQSHVAFGAVGSSAASFPLQLLGFSVSALHSASLSSHTGYPVAPSGHRASAAELLAAVEALSANGLLGRHGLLLSGYLPSAELLAALSEALQRLRAAGGGAFYLCDPVLGDYYEAAPATGAAAAAAAAAAAPPPLPTGRLYVPAALIPAFRQHIGRGVSLLTPNAFEAEQLTGCGRISDVASALAAAEALHGLGARAVCITSSPIVLAPGTMLLLVSCAWEDVQRECAEGRWAGEEAEASLPVLAGSSAALRLPAVRRGLLFPGGRRSSSAHAAFGILIPKLPASFTGTGDMLAALLLAHCSANPGDMAQATEAAVATVFAVCQRSLAARAAELAAREQAQGEAAQSLASADRVAASELRVVEARLDIEAPELRQDMQAFAL